MIFPSGLPLYVLQRTCLSHLCGLFSDCHSQMLSLCLALSPEALQCLVLPPDDSQCVATETRPQLAIESTDLCTRGDNATLNLQSIPLNLPL